MSIIRLKQKISRTFAVFSALVLLLLVSCTRHLLTVHSDYVTIESLASFHAGTPDPLLDCPPFGQRLVISWSVQKELLKLEDPHVLLTLRFRNRDQIVRKVPLKRAQGTTLYRVLNEKYCETGGFLTYRVQVIAGGSIYEEWRHQLWAELICVDLEENEEGDDEAEEARDGDGGDEEEETIDFIDG